MELKRFLYSDKLMRQKAFEIRNKVFIEEQRVDMREEFDEFDLSSVHYLVVQGDDAIGTARWRFTEMGIKLERFAVLEEARKKGVGSLMLKEILDEIPKYHRVYLHAQVQVIPFYSQFGFTKEGDLFSECNIDHYKMNLQSAHHTNKLAIQTAINFVRKFHDSFGIPVKEEPVAFPGQNTVELRHRLMQEENEEYLQAALEDDLTEVADALGDMLYILCGTILSHGLQYKIEEVYSEIQRSNMSKLDKDGKAIYREDGKVMKSELYFKPDIDSILNSD